MIAAILTICGATVLTSCSKDDDDKNTIVQPVKEYFTLWNQCEALTALQDYVKDVTNPNSPNYIKAEDRIATFDMDGTFVGELYPTYFEYNLLEYRALDDATYEAPKDVMEAGQAIRDFVRNGKKLPDHFDMVHAYAAAKAYSGMTLAEFDAYVKAYAAKPANGFSGMTYGQSFYKPMLEVFDYLKDNGFTYYVVSGSDRFICRALVESIGIEPNRVIGMDVKLHSTSQDTEEGVNYTMGKEEDRIATFDMDGTFVGELYPTYFEYNLLEYRALDDASYQAPKDVMETAQEIRDFVRNGKKLPDHFDMKHAHAAAKAYAGMTLAQFDAYVKAYAQQPANGFSGMTYGQSFY